MLHLKFGKLDWVKTAVWSNSVIRSAPGALYKLVDPQRGLVGSREVGAIGGAVSGVTGGAGLGMLAGAQEDWLVWGDKVSIWG